MKKNAPPVTEPKQEQSKTENPPVDKPISNSVVEPPILNIDLKSMDPNLLKTAESFGIPLKAILNYVDALQNYNISVEARLRAIVQNLEPAVEETVNKMVAKARAQALTASQSAPTEGDRQPSAGPAPPNAMAGMLNILPQLMPLITGAASQDPFAEMAKTYFLEQMKDSQAFMKAFQQTALSKLAGKMANELVP